MSLLPMPGNRIQEIRECYQQAADCVQQAEAQNDPKVKKQFLELTRRWLLLARCYTNLISRPRSQNGSGAFKSQ
jgi:hypothetical protein